MAIRRIGPKVPLTLHRYTDTMSVVIEMTLQQLMNTQKISRYRLSKTCGIPWATLADICSGKTHLERCSAGTLAKLSSALGVSMEELLKLEIQIRGEPDGKAYLEVGLPGFIQKAIDDYLLGEKQQVNYLDCLMDELYGAVNSAVWGGDITEEQASHLRAKYLLAPVQEETDD